MTKDDIKISNRNWYLKNKEKTIERNKKWKLNNPIRHKEISKQIRQRYRRTSKGIYRDLKQNAFRRGLEVMKQDDFITWHGIQEKICIYCGINEKDHGARMSIDRMNNDQGYIDGNLCLACNLCNSIKSNLLTFDEMKVVGELVIKKRYK